MRMDEYDGKQFLAAVRNADYAHAGEAEAIDLVFSKLSARPDWSVLDVGSGRGGTADYVNRNGWGRVLGIDIDGDAIEYARSKYPGVEFAICDMHEIGKQFPGRFDLIYSFNAFYASKDKANALSSFREASRSQATLAIFDYVLYKPEAELPRVFLGQTPVTFDELAQFTRASRWKAEESINLDARYAEWYQNFIERFDEPGIRANYSNKIILEVKSKYTELLDSIKNGVLGGAAMIYRAI